MLTIGDGVKVKYQGVEYFGEVTQVKYRLDCSGRPWLMDEVRVDFELSAPYCFWVFTGNYIKQLILVRESTIEGDKRREQAKRD